MALNFDSWLLELGAVLVTLFLALFLALQLFYLNRFQYWKRKGIPYEEPSFPFGNIADVAMQRIAESDGLKATYRRFDGHKVAGQYHLSRPALIVRDPEEIKKVLVKDFPAFHDRGAYYNEEREPLTGHIFNLVGARWKNLRAKLTPTFTSGKMKMMYPIMAECGEELRGHLLPVARRGEAIEIKDVMAKYTTDVIASCAFGIQCNSLRDEHSEFRENGRLLFKSSVVRRLRTFLATAAPRVLGWSHIPLIVPEVARFFLRVVKETVEYRETNNVQRKDFMQLLIALKNNRSVANEGEPTKHNPDDATGLTIEQVAAQAFEFYVAGFETSSTTLSFCLYELAVNPLIQDRLREEVDRVLQEHGGKLNYEAIQEMEYLDRVIAETLRKYPPASRLIRVCTQPYRLPDSEQMLDVGTLVFIPVIGVHHDPQYYPDPEVFDPERFTAEEKAKRNHYVYLPFGEGGRNCIGSRFGLLQTKVGLASILPDYQFNLCKERTPVPLVMDPKSVILSAKGGIYLQVQKIN